MHTDFSSLSLVLFIVKECGYSCCQRHLTWAKEKKIWTVVFHLETKVLESGGRVEKLIVQVA